jgi:hypothetical protein
MIMTPIHILLITMWFASGLVLGWLVGYNEAIGDDDEGRGIGPPAI